MRNFLATFVDIVFTPVESYYIFNAVLLLMILGGKVVMLQYYTT